VGRLLLRASLATPSVRPIFAAVGSQLGIPVAENDGLASFPRLVPRDADVVAKKLPAGGGWLVGTETDSQQTFLFRFGKVQGPKGKAATDDFVAELAQAGKFSPSFAVVARGNLTWTFYDTDGDGTFDVVLFGDGREPKVVKSAWRVAANGPGRLAPDLVKGPLVRVTLLPKASQAAAKKAFAEYFADGV
jgi:hypothetical protein